MSQQELGFPLTRAYVSAVECGRVVPSLPALQHMADRLGVPLSDFFDAVERQLSNDS
jgi:transcriptional regulator with XRE-family HTH domain